MATAGNLCTTIISDLGRSDLSMSDVVLIDIQSSIREYEAQRFYFNEQLLTVTLSATDTYALSLFAPSGSNVSDVIEVDNFDVIINSSRKYRLAELTYRDFIEVSANSSGNQGYPQFFSIWNQAMKIFPLATTAGYTGELWAHIKFTEIAAVGFSTSNPWTNDASDLIRNATLKRLWGRRYRDMDAAQMAALAERDSLAALRRRTNALGGNVISGYL
jgi:hypothetical protein